MLVSADDQEFGKISSFEKKTALFRLKNAGDAPGDILRFIPTCSCISGTADKMRLEPQEETEVRIVLDASAVSGGFKRTLWVETNDPAQPRILLSVRGEVTPLFNGLPPSHQRVVLAEGETWTNRFTLTEAETNLFLREPILSADTNKLFATVSLVTNTQGKTSYDVTLIVTPLAAGRYPLSLAFPVGGRPNLRPLQVSFDVQIGSELKAFPSRIMLIPSEQPQTRFVHIMTPEKNLNTNALSWTPQREGVSVLVEPSPKSTFIRATLTLSPEAVAKLLKEQDAQMTFHYRNIKSTSVSFFARPEPATHTVKSAKDQ